MGRSVTSSPAGQVLVLDPPTQLTFHGPYTEVIRAKLRLSNPSERQVCFKIKSNVPRQYCVQPSIAVVLPHGHTDVSVLLQPVTDGARPDADCQHKFIVETIFTPDKADVTSLERLWHQTKAGDVMHSRLSCVFEEPPKAIYNGPAPEIISSQKSEVINTTSSSSSSSGGISTYLLFLVLLALVAAIVYNCLV